MRHLNKFFAALLLVAASSTNVFAVDAADCREALATFKGLGNVDELLAQSVGYAILPTIGKAGIGIGGAGGSGCVYKGGAQTGTVKMGQVTIGWQLGGQAYSQLILFKTNDVYKEFTTGEFEFGVQATAVALTYGANAEAGTKGASSTAGETKGKAGWERGMAVFTVAKGGLMYEASIGGQKFNYKPL